ncbi:hypothetical protein [Aquimarina sp. AU474]|uniref:hypothetical protein n=1 Tax=Aquimarina sp. AU474 TaxID=2108529 RepID=UPI000D692FAF|nr:hypothetical protein [Aquimarina sp. AU474]
MKSLKHLTVLVFVLIGFLSCTNDYELKKEANKQLGVEEIFKNYNNKLKKEVVQKKGGKFWQAVKVALADVAAGVGSFLVMDWITDGEGEFITAGVVSAAAGAASDAVSTSFNGSGIGSFDIKYKLPDHYAKWDLGERHNDILRNVYHHNIQIDQYILSIYGEEVLSVFNSDEVVQMKSKILDISTNYLNSGFELDYLVEEYKKQELISQNVAIVFTHLQEGLLLCNSDTDVSLLLSFYSKNIMDSKELQEKEKESLFIALSIARSSLNYWVNFTRQTN